jgi:glutamine---fructose-6-phosphate transaminase (isomerizing)
MCGIIGILGKGDVAPQLVESLKRLEYRGYDSAGVATLNNGLIERRRAPGKLNNLDRSLTDRPLLGHVGIGHTRWATHGAPNETNAHPHATARVAVVHNGIIENFRALREELEAAGYKHESATDTEVVAQLVTKLMDDGLSARAAVEETLKRVTGAFALAFLFTGEEDLLIAARKGSPLAIGWGEGEMFLGSDAIALAPFTHMITYLDEGDYAIITRKGAKVFDEAGNAVDRGKQITQATGLLVDKGNHRPHAGQLPRLLCKRGTHHGAAVRMD